MSKAMCRYVTSARGSRAQAAQMEARPERRSLDSDGGSEMDADCCGDSGRPIKAAPEINASLPASWL